MFAAKMRRLVTFVLFLQAVGAQTSNFNLTLLGQLVSDCGTGWGCFLQGCDSGSRSRCSYVAMYRNNSDMFEFVLSTKGYDYAALGFSADQSMGGDEVLACLKVGSGSVIIDHYFNPNGHDPSRRSSAFLLSWIGSFYENGQIGCRFTRPRQANGISDYLDLTQAFYQLYVYGPVQYNAIAFHVPVVRPSTSTKTIMIATYRTLVGIPTGTSLATMPTKMLGTLMVAVLTAFVM